MHKDNKFLFARRRNEHWKEMLRRDREENEERATAVLYVCSAAEKLPCILPLLRLYNGALWEGLLFCSALDGNASPLFLIRAKQLGLPFRVVNRRFIFCFPLSQMLKQHIWDSGSGLKTKAVRAHSLLTNVPLFCPRRECFCWLYEITVNEKKLSTIVTYIIVWEHMEYLRPIFTFKLSGISKKKKKVNIMRHYISDSTLPHQSEVNERHWSCKLFFNSVFRWAVYAD